MRKILAFLTLFCLMCGLVCSADAATAARSANSYTTVAADGSCQTTLTVTVHLDAPVEDLTFPLPGNAKNITVNGSRAHGRLENGVRHVKLSGIIGKTAGDFTLTFTYSLEDVLETNEVQQLQLRLPLLSGFSYPVEAMEFSVTLPGQVHAKPAFSSGYHQANIEKDILYTVTGATVTGTAQAELKDHETLVMTLTVSEEMFPQKKLTLPDFQTVNTLFAVCSLLALVYWAVFLRNLPGWPHICPNPPEGCSAGQLGSALCLQGGDLNMLVFSWAQLGYLRIALEPSGRVRLYKQMDMGNERGSHEQKSFQLLLGRREMVDTGSARYGEVSRAVAKRMPNLSAFVHPRSGNLRVFRGLSALAGVFCGVSLGIGMSAGAALQWFWVVVMGALALVSSWHIQQWAAALFASVRRPFWKALVICGAWLAVAAFAGFFSVGLKFVMGQLFAGLLAAFGGRRTREGRQVMGEILGLRRYLCKVSRTQLQQICRSNPEYFHQMAPFALALGVDRRFAKRFGGIPIGQCPYISIGTDSTLTAGQWVGVMRRVLTSMNAHQQNGLREKLTALLRLFLK